MADPDLVDPPKGSVAVATSAPSAYPSIFGNGTTELIDDMEVQALRWPQSIKTCESMRRDAQVTAMFYSLTVPIRRYPWAIDRNGAEDEVVEKFADDVSLPVIGEDPPRPIGRTRNRFNHDEHLLHALLSLIYGHQFFEQQGYIDDDLNWRLRKLFPIMARTIGKINIAQDGGLVDIRQNIVVRPGQMQPPPIPINQLVGYIWNKEGANWYGRSLLIPVYRHWLVKDRLIRVDAVKHERTGAGVPIIEAPMGASGNEIARLDAMAQRYKVGEAAGGAVPAGTKFRLVGVEGATSDVLASIRYQDEQIASSFFQEVKTLGQSAYGSRALGETFAGLALPIQEAVAGWYARTFNEHVIEDWVDWNFGGDYGAPRLVYKDPALETPGLPEAEKAAMAEKEQATKVLAGTAEIWELSQTALDGGTRLLNLTPEDERALHDARLWASGVLARAA